MDWGLITNFLVLAGTVVATIGSLTWWLSSQFKATRDLIYTQVGKVLEKLEYHEKHDDTRFQEVKNDIWEIRLRNAAIDGKVLTKHRREERFKNEGQRQVQDS